MNMLWGVQLGGVSTAVEGAEVRSSHSGRGAVAGGRNEAGVGFASLLSQAHREHVHHLFGGGVSLAAVLVLRGGRAQTSQRTVRADADDTADAGGCGERAVHVGMV